MVHSDLRKHSCRVFTNEVSVCTWVDDDSSSVRNADGMVHRGLHLRTVAHCGFRQPGTDGAWYGMTGQGNKFRKSSGMLAMLAQFMVGSLSFSLLASATGVGMFAVC